MDEKHSLLRRQLKRYLYRAENVPEPFQRFVEAVDEAYRQFDADRLMLERSLDLSSQELLQANSEMRAVCQRFPDLYFRVNGNGVILDCNAAEPEILSVEPRDLVGRRLPDVLVPERAEELRQAMAWVVNSKATATLEYAQEAKGVARYYEASLFPLLDAQILVFVRNITERKQGEAERSRLATAVEAAGEAIVISDTQAVILYVNPAFERMTGYAREETVGRNASLLKSGRHDDAFYRDMWKTLSEGRVWSGQFANRRKDASVFLTDSTISPIRDAAGTVVNYVSVSRDVTREVELEEELRQAQKMEAVGHLAGGIAHDFNNLLTAILGYSELALRNLPEKHPARRDIDEVRAASMRATALTNQLLVFGRRQDLFPRVLNVNGIVLEVVRLLRRVIAENIELSTDVGRVSPVRVDPIQVEQVLMNLVLNARDAMPDGGKLRIETRDAAIDDAEAARYADVKPGPYVALTVSDTGIGMDEATRARIFEPFFTTKGVGKGTGLGLSTVYGIVKQSGGHISVYSEPGKGSTFCAFFPALPGAAEETAAAEQPLVPASLLGSETVLVVEDEAPIRKLAAEMLGHHGYAVLTARDGAAALEVAAGHGGPIHLLLTDVIMPGISGGELAAKLRQARPDIRVIYMSGHPSSTLSNLGVLGGEIQLLRKPFTGNELALRVRRLLDARI
jgi:two-component system, cell cycle sensor histidine kinase and response regulator CckA